MVECGRVWQTWKCYHQRLSTVQSANTLFLVGVAGATVRVLGFKCMTITKHFAPFPPTSTPKIACFRDCTRAKRLPFGVKWHHCFHAVTTNWHRLVWKTKEKLTVESACIRVSKREVAVFSITRALFAISICCIIDIARTARAYFLG